MGPPSNLQRTGLGRKFAFGTAEQKAAAAQAENDVKDARDKALAAALAATHLDSKKKAPAPEASTAQSSVAAAQAPSANTSQNADYQTKAPSWATPTGRERVVRHERSQKDVVLSASNITKNRLHQAEYRFPNGRTKYFNTNKFDNDVTSFPGEYRSMTSEDKQAFWKDTWLEIFVDIGAVETAEAEISSVLEKMDKLGPELYKCPHVYVSLLFTSLPTDEQDMKLVGKEACAPLYPQSPVVEFRASPSLLRLSTLVERLQNFKSLKKMGIVIRAPKNDFSVISWSQLQQVLPFYQLNFRNWNLAYQPNFATQHPLFVEHVVIQLLDAEARKIRKAEQAAPEPAMEWGVIKVIPSAAPKE